MTESPAGTFRSAGRKPGDILPRMVDACGMVRRLAPAALSRLAYRAGSVMHRLLPGPRKPFGAVVRMLLDWSVAAL